jgi:hypothetical protein
MASDRDTPLTVSPDQLYAHLSDHAPEVAGYCDSEIYLACSCGDWDNLAGYDFINHRALPSVTFADHVLATLAAAVLVIPSSDAGAAE